MPAPTTHKQNSALIPAPIQPSLTPRRLPTHVHQFLRPQTEMTPAHRTADRVVQSAVLRRRRLRLLAPLVFGPDLHADYVYAIAARLSVLESGAIVIRANNRYRTLRIVWCIQVAIEVVRV